MFRVFRFRGAAGHPSAGLRSRQRKDRFGRATGDFALRYLSTRDPQPQPDTRSFEEVLLADLAEERMSSGEPALLIVERHRRAFADAREALAATLGPDAAEWELIAEDLRRAAAAMDRIVGRIGAEDVLGEIFARLCVGK